MRPPKGQNDFCTHCEEFNTVLDGICCRCKWNRTENRQATEEEIVLIKAKIDKAIKALEDALDG